MAATKLTVAQALHLALHGRTQAELASFIGASSRSIRRWKSGEAAPTKKHLKALLSEARAVRQQRIKAGAPKLTVPPRPVTQKVTRVIERYEDGRLILERRQITHRSFDTRGLTRDQITDLVMELQKRKKQVRFFLRMPSVSDEGRRYRNRVGSTGWNTLVGANRAAIDRRVLRALQVGESIPMITIADDPLAQ